MVLSSVKNDLENHFTSCQTYIRTLLQVTHDRNDILTWFQGLCQHLTKIIELIGQYYKEIKEESPNLIQNTLLMYLTQVLTSLSLLINIFVSEDEIKLVVSEARKCVIKQMSCCLDSIEVALTCEQSLTDPSGNFVKWMDAALDKVAQIDIREDKSQALETYKETRELFEEVLSHAMSIAQVSLTEDSKMIRRSCQAVLTTLSSLDKEINNTPTNGAMVNLFIDTCSDKLCVLEKKVNTAVLKLCLETFAQFSKPLDKISNFCSDHNNKNKMDELDSLVADFDLHVDRIMQIGLFAVSCSSDFARGIKIRSCLASLEALESELVPALTSSLLDNSKHNVNCARILTNHWLNQAACLQQFIFLIIDPFAFCQIIYEEAADIIDNLSNSLRKKNMIKEHDTASFILTAKVLQTFLNKAHNEFNESETNKVKTKVDDFNEVLEEVESASRFLLSEENISVDNCKRVLKRCKILLTVLKRIWLCFADEVVLNKNISSVSSKLSSKLDNVRLEPTGNPFLDHIIHRGKQILQDRSVLYRTPIKSCVSTKGIQIRESRRKETPLSKAVHLRKLSFANVTNKNETTLDLQITEILNEMTHLSTSLRPNR